MTTERENIIALAIKCELIEGPHNDAQNKQLEAFYKAAQAEAFEAAAKLCDRKFHELTQ